MASNITPLDQFTSPVIVPDDGDAVNGTETLLTAQALADRSQFLFNRMPQGVAQTAYPVSMSAISIKGGSFNNLSWLPGTAGWLQESLTSTFRPIADITQLLPVGGTLDTIRAHVLGAADSAPHGAFPGALDAQLPFIQLVSLVRSTQVEATAGTVIDPSTSNAEYEVIHTIESTGLAVTVDPLKNYFIEFRGETGAGWGIVDSCAIVAFEIGWTP